MIEIYNKKVKYLFDDIFKGITIPYEDDETDFIVFGQRNNAKRGISFEDCKYTNEFIFSHRPEKEFLKYGDILINGLGGGTCGRVGFYDIKSNIKVLTDGIPYILRNKKVNKYLYYALFCNQNQLEFLALGATNQVSLKDFDLKNFNLSIVKDTREQKRIADYLDVICLKVDKTINDLSEEIDIIKRYKKSLITEVITRGLHGEILKKTNYQYWPEIPVNWKLADIKYIFEIVKRIAGKEGYDILSVTQQGIKIKDISTNEGQIASNYSGYQLVYPTDYVMNHMDLLTGWVDCSQFEGVTSPDYRVFRLRNKSQNDLTYFKYVLQSCYFNRVFYSLGAGVSNLGRWRLQAETFNNFLFPVPPYLEQIEISKYLDEKCKKINTILASKEEQLILLENYKKTLIYEYVIGKKEVPANE